MSQPKAASKSEPRRPTEAESFCFHHLGSVVLAQLQSNFIAAELWDALASPHAIAMEDG
jgi:hypothetical protein